MRDTFADRPPCLGFRNRYKRGRTMDVGFWRGVLQAAVVIGTFVAVGVLCHAALVAGRCSPDPVYANQWRESR